MTCLLPVWLRPWRCRSCGNWHRGLAPICIYTNVPRDHS